MSESVTSTLQVGDPLWKLQARAEEIVGWAGISPTLPVALGDDIADDPPEPDRVAVAKEQIEAALEVLAGEPVLASVMAEGTRVRASRSNFLFGLLGYLSACVPARVQLPGPPAESPLGVFAIVAGPSGATKSALLDAVRRVVPTDVSSVVVDVEPVSGEGLHDAFLGLVPDPDDPEKEVVAQTTSNVFVSFDELETLAAQAGWSSSTLWSRLRTGWSGKPLRAAMSQRDKGKRARPEVTDYQLGAVVASTFEDAAAVMADTSRGTAQRWLCGWSFDPTRTSVDGVPLRLVLKGWPGLGESLVGVDASVAAEIERNAELKLDGDERAVWGHGLLARLRVAALIGWLRDHPGMVDVQDWNLASWVVYLSNAASVLVIDAGRDEQAKQHRVEGEAYGHRELGRDAVKHQHETKKREWLVARALKVVELQRHGSSRAQALKQATAGRHLDMWRSLSLNESATRAVLKEFVSAAVADLESRQRGA